MTTGLNNPKPQRQHLAPRRIRRNIIIFILILAGIAAFGITARYADADKVEDTTEKQSVRTVTLVKPIPGGATEDLVLPGDLRAYNDSPIYARTSGYLKRWLVDIGAQVKSGQLLAEIESPEVDQQLLQAKADVAQARTNAELATLTATRWQDLLKTNSVSQQETDEKVSDANAKKAALQATQANVSRLSQLQGFERVYAPFDGTIVERNTDIGALIAAGNTSGQQLFRIASTDKLRVYVQVPETYARAITPDIKATLAVAEHPGETFPARLVTTSEAVAASSRTMLVQLEIDNATGNLFAGSYVEVHFALPADPGTLRVPVNCLLFRAEGMMVGVVDHDNIVHLTPVTIGRDFGNSVEIASGLKPDDQIVINVPDSLNDKEKVEIAKPDQQPEAKGGDKSGKDKSDKDGNDKDAKGKNGKDEADQKKIKSGGGDSTAEKPADVGTGKGGNSAPDATGDISGEKNDKPPAKAPDDQPDNAKK